VKISIDKIDHNNRVGVMYYPSVEKILACFPNAALLYQVNTVRLKDNTHMHCWCPYLDPFKYLGLLGSNL
jgi:hypothetical protein